VETERLLLRQFREQDLDAYAALLADAELMRYFNDGLATREQAWRHMAMHDGHWMLLGYGRWAVELKATGRMIGRVGMWCPEGWPEIELGWLLARDHWGYGYATEAAREGLRHTFGALALSHAISLIHPDNARSIRVAERLGGTLEQTIFFHGHDTLVYGYNAPP
jgi:RimJ/RimL family protein N-acetyltransferase